MPTFSCTVRDSSGIKRTFNEEASSQEELVSRLQAQNLIVVSVSSAAKDEPKMETNTVSASLPKSRKGMHSNISSDDLVLFCRHLATLLSAGVTILKCLEIISKQVTSRKLYKVLDAIMKDMQAGTSFHAGLAKHPKVFSELWINIAESGEASGSLAMVLERLAGYLERNASFKGKIISALSYPTILALAAIGAILFLTLKIIPTFAEVFKGFNIELPLLTQMILLFSAVMQKYFLVAAGGIVVGFFAFKKYIATPIGRRWFEQFKFSLPVLGEFFKVLTTERFASTMSTLLEAGVPIMYSLEISEHSVGNVTVSEIIRQVKEDVRQGKPLGASLDKYGFFEPMVVQMVTVGEEVGELPNMFKRLNNFYQEYVETFLTRITALFEPIMLLVMAGVIGIMVVGMFLPIFKISQVGG